MTFKEFKLWCSERSCDGYWSISVAAICIEIIKVVNNTVFWKREKIWQSISHHYEIEKNIVHPINKKINDLAKGET